MSILRIRRPLHTIHHPYRPPDPWSFEDQEEGGGRRCDNTRDFLRNPVPSSLKQKKRKRNHNPLPPSPLRISTIHNLLDPDPTEGEREHQEEQQEDQQEDQQEEQEKDKENNEQLHTWLQSDTENPYVELTDENVKNLAPPKSVWIKYRSHEGEYRKGGILRINAFPKYVMLYNPYVLKVFSVQLNKNTLYARRDAIE